MREGEREKKERARETERRVRMELLLSVPATASSLLLVYVLVHFRSVVFLLFFMSYVMSSQFDSKYKTKVGSIVHLVSNICMENFLNINEGPVKFLIRNYKPLVHEFKS